MTKKLKYRKIKNDKTKAERLYKVFLTFPKFKHRMLSMDNLKRCLEYIDASLKTISLIVKFKQTFFFCKKDYAII